MTDQRVSRLTSLADVLLLGGPMDRRIVRLDTEVELAYAIHCLNGPDKGWHNYIIVQIESDTSIWNVGVHQALLVRGDTLASITDRVLALVINHYAETRHV